ncbi:MAG: hypothetical protein LBE92_02360 [Chryseobacterium sp.]|jgi:post-segregation antitoxin (ccd killing protein)|uniref:hypothetical protein n=1 Tax=Chryseobacterium sp. TaxID=1871047 RepID=UPI002820E1AD|nr:hypothetical protein [Chryseobacterium sp.]MDR2234943.1 hypothetical protein [Chryseobacterium sp.]
MDIVKHIAKHTEDLRNGFTDSSPEQRKSLVTAVLRFYFLLDDFDGIIARYINISLEKEQLIADINRENTRHYQEANEKSLAETDEYADDYEEPDPIELFVLDAFSNAVSDLNKVENIVGLLIGVIDTLDYYENFSDHPEFWNEILEKEVRFQNEISSDIKSQKIFDPMMYHERYHKIITQHTL